MAGWYRLGATGADIEVRVTVRAGGERIDPPLPLSDGQWVLPVRLKAVPEKGAANAALERLLARRLGVAPTTVTVVSGHKSRRKTLHVAGAGKTLRPALEALTGEGGQ